MKIGNLRDDVTKGKNLATSSKGSYGRHEFGVECTLGSHSCDKTRKETSRMR